MEARQKRPRFPLSTIFHIFHVCISIGLVIAVVRNQLVNEARFERLEKNDCKCPTDKTQRMDAASESLDSITNKDITLPNDVTSVHSVARRASDEQLASGFKEEQYRTTDNAELFLTNQSTSTSNMKEGSVNSTRPIPGTMTGAPVPATTIATESLNQEKQLNSSGPKMYGNLLSEEKRSLISCFNELKFFIENQVKPGKVDHNMEKGCQLLRGPKGEPGEKGQRGMKGAIGPNGCSGTFFAYPTFEPSPRNLVFKEGDPAVLSCNATANPSSQITWYRDNVMLTGKRDNSSHRYFINNREVVTNPASSRVEMCPSEIPHPVTQSSLVIKQSRGSDTGTYVCKARNILGVYSYKIRILVQVYVQFTKTPANLTVVQGNDAQLSCRASGVPTPVITWYRKDGGAMPSRYNITGGDLHIHNISKKEEGTFVCLATNVIGSKTTEATITVNVFPKIASFLDQQITINESHTLVLPCNATGYPNPEIRWSKVNDSLPEGRYAYDSQMLNISRVKYEDRGEYICISNNTVGNSAKKVMVIVQAGPNIIRRPDVAEFGYQSHPKRIRFEVYAWPIPEITWKRPYWNRRSDARFRQENGDLIIENVQYTDSGRYQATAKNILGEVEVSTFLVVRDAVPPYITKKLPTSIVLRGGQNFSIECSVAGIPTPRIVWKHSMSNDSIEDKTLNIVNASYQHSGNYTCIAENKFGVVQQHLIIRVAIGIRLVGSANDYEGRVEVYHDGQWGTVCDDGWDMNDARVVCRQLGFTDAQSAPQSATYGQGSGPILLDDVRCTGSERRLQDCGHKGWGSNNCGHGEDTGVVCIQ